MSLATRCGHCGTIFRVVQDQLKVSEGWVRCGRCGDVFNALQALFDLEREAPPPFTGQARDAHREPTPTRNTPLTPVEPGHGPAPVAAGTAMPEVPGAEADMPDTVDASRNVSTDPSGGLPTDPAPPLGFDADPAPATSGPGGPAWRDAPPGDARSLPIESADTRAEPGFDPTRQDDALTRVDDPIDADRLARAEAGTVDAIPGFLREDRARSVASPLARALWGFAAVLLTLGLGVQIAVQNRDLVAQSWPWSRPLLVQWCAVRGCELLDAPRRIQAFTVETSSLTRQSPTGEVYRFSVTLRNRDARPALMPSIDLSLDDAGGQLLVRRALNPADFRVNRPVVAGGADATLQLVMTAAQGQASGYRIELFYP